jgi:hypothetical protein
MARCIVVRIVLAGNRSENQLVVLGPDAGNGRRGGETACVRAFTDRPNNCEELSMVLGLRCPESWRVVRITINARTAWSSYAGANTVLSACRSTDHPLWRAAPRRAH